MRSQRTLSTPVEFSGRGLHSGEDVRVRVLPAAEDTGVEFVRTDLPDALPIPAHIRGDSKNERSSQMERGGSGEILQDEEARRLVELDPQRAHERRGALGQAEAAWARLQAL